MDEFGVGHRDTGPAETRAANRRWWDAEAAPYYLEHGDFLGDEALVWGPEGHQESRLHLLGDVRGRRVLEIGAGAAQGARHLARCGAQVVATDLSHGMLRQAQAIDAGNAHGIPLVQCDAVELPFAADSFDIVFTAYGAVPFVADSAALMREAARVLHEGGRFVFATTHAIRWAFPDVPGAEGLTAHWSYFDRTPYVEQDDDGNATYVEHHRTTGDRVREIHAAGLRLVDLVEPEWPADNLNEWGGWSPTRGAVLPGTAIFVTERS
ncbi:class I SAM-dependent methyltransferase [Rudaeicoccus suwonensis]|uniref:Methyltransferase family protein n=1 Tax=Rudaeicoccus suwonensis TaxID=657409 RepID=A0A561EAK3_9MICO|nr:class I SAM-dependent methyltransferase [Rudaeicoccus suwonensis]TWE12643.1 methyltransferase family protein [Rudaeicoccus suwonensis]